MPTILDSDERLRALMDAAEPRLRRSFLQAFLQLKLEHSLDELAEMIAAGRFDEALASVEAAAARFATSANAAVVGAGSDTASFLASALNQLISFDQSNDRAVRILRGKRDLIIREVTADTQRAIFNALSDATERGLNPKAQARLFRDTLGLTSRQERTVANYRAALERGGQAALSRELRDRRFDRTVESAARAGRQLRPEQIDRMVDRYRQRLLAHRARMVARTEALRAVHEGADEMYQQAFDSGTLDPGSILQTWVTASDGKVRDTHASMNGQVQPVGSRFVTGGGSQLRFPGDIDAPASETIHCRCAVARRVTTI